MSNAGFPKFNLVNLLSQAQQLISGGSNDIGVPSTPIPTGPPTLQQQLAKLTMAALFADESVRLPADEVATFLKDAMKLPEELRTTLMMMALEATPETLKKSLKQTLKQVIQDNANELTIPLDEMQKLLGKNTDEAKSKLMKLLQASPISQTQSGPQVAELVKTLDKMSEKIKQSPMHATETLVLLYLPIYPLVPPQKMDLSFEDGSGGEEGQERDMSVVMYLETNTLGRFKIVVSQYEPLQVGVLMFHEKIAAPILPILKDKTNEQLAKDGLPAAIFDTSLLNSGGAAQETSTSSSNAENTAANADLSEGFKRATRQEDKQEVNIQPGDSVSLIILNTAYALSRWIFELDEQNRPLQKSAKPKPKS